MDPPAYTLATHLLRTGTFVRPEEAFGLGDKAERELYAYRETMWDDLPSRSPGGYPDLLRAWTNALQARKGPRFLESALQAQGEESPRRENAAVVTVQAAGTFLELALVIHTAREPWYANVVLSTVRTALELAAKSLQIFRGTADEPMRWRTGHEQACPRDFELNATACCERLTGELRVLEGSCPDAAVVYRYLCQFIHFDARPAVKPPSHGDAYAGLAFTAWAAAAVADTISGTTPRAVYPAAWPTPLPW